MGSDGEQLTRQEIAGMTPEAITEAHDAGRVAAMLSGVADEAIVAARTAALAAAKRDRVREVLDDLSDHELAVAEAALRERLLRAGRSS